MASTKSKSQSKGKDTPAKRDDSESSTKSHVATETKGKKMTDLPSVIEFDEDISSQEAPVPLPVGDYPAEVRAASQKIGSTSGKKYAAVQLFVAPEAYPADYTEGEPDGLILGYNRVSLENTPQARFRLRKFCEAIGAPMGKTIDLNSWVGRSCTISVVNEEWEGVDRAVVGKVTAA